ncbi:MAG: DnaB-like helicase C-terminal domain-containing protein, partial [Selenomonadaceae bacterium]|nr:DnaB-like helicase C-terminal domain-containing protein [Selenomonadaceae bacterium]
LTCGLKKTDLIILAARPSMGKTALGLNIALNASRKVPVGIFSLEMSAGQLGQRILSMTSGVDISDIATGNFDDADEDCMMMSLAGVYDLQKHVEIDDGTMTIAELRMRARRMKRKYDVGLIVIDYIQLIIGDKSYKGNRVQEVSDISRQLKAMAKELNVPVLALSQLNRGTELRADKRPLLSDLRESGSIEQDADIVMFIYRDAYYNEDSEQKNVVEINIAKNRNGATGRCNLYFDGSKCRFRDLVREV